VTAMTAPAEAHWSTTPARYRREERSAAVGRGESVWRRAATDVLRWRVKTASGFHVDDASPVRVGARPVITVGLLGTAVREPVEVVEVVKGTDRVGFAYRTLPGHPVEGEEAFVISRSGDEVRLTVRSLTRPAAEQPWRALFPALLVAQAVAHRRYLRALR